MKPVDDRVFEESVGVEKGTVTIEVLVKTCPSDVSTTKERLEEEVPRDREEVVDEVVAEEAAVVEPVVEVLERMPEEDELAAELEPGMEDVVAVVEVGMDEEEEGIGVEFGAEESTRVDEASELDCAGGITLPDGICDMASSYGGNERDARERQLNDRWKSESEVGPNLKVKVSRGKDHEGPNRSGAKRYLSRQWTGYIVS